MVAQLPMRSFNLAMRNRVVGALAAATLGIIALTFALLVRNRYRFEANFVCSKISDASSGSDSLYWIEKLFHEPGRKQKLAVAIERMATGDSQLDCALLEFIDWPGYRPPHDLGWSQREEETFEQELQDFFVAVVDQARYRPGLTDLFLHRFRYREAAQYVGEDFNMVAILQSDILPSRSHPEDIPESDAARAIALLVACRLTDNDDLLPLISIDTLDQVALSWEHWLEENGPFLRFDSLRGRLVVDRTAKETNTPVEEDADWVTFVNTPLPHWTPSESWGYVLPLWYTIRK